jgi:FkbM family methyltransferase
MKKEPTATSFRGTVIDVGASNGDSSIFFALHGAQTVIALEPDPESFELAKDNVKANGLEDKVRLLNAALSNEDGTAKLFVPQREPNASSLSVESAVKSVDFKRAKEVIVRTVSLKTLLKTYGMKDVFLLKMDCEGCEYAAISAPELETLQKIKNIRLEYHDGPRELASVLSKAGFTVETSGGSAVAYLKASRSRSSHLTV